MLTKWSLYFTNFRLVLKLLEVSEDGFQAEKGLSHVKGSMSSTKIANPYTLAAQITYVNVSTNMSEKALQQRSQLSFSVIG